MPDLARGHQSKQSPCRLRGGGWGTLQSLKIESIADGILAPAPVLVLDGYQPVHGLAHHRVLVAHPGGIERAQHRPGAIDVVHSPAAIPRPFRKLGPAQVSNPGCNGLTVLSGLAELSQHRD